MAHYFRLVSWDQILDLTFDEIDLFTDACNAAPPIGCVYVLIPKK